MKIVNLKEYECHINEIAKWHFDEWAYLYPDKNQSDFENDLKESLSIDFIPQTWLIFDDDNLVCGTTSLLKDDMKTNLDLSPWLANVYITKNKRGKGLGKHIVLAVMKKAFDLGIKCLYLFTDSQLNFYSQLGWVAIKKETYEGNIVYIMKYNFPDKAD